MGNNIGTFKQDRITCQHLSMHLIQNKNEMVTWIDAMRSHPFYLATDVLQAALRVCDRSENEGSMSSSLFSQDSVQTENVECSQKEEKWDI